LPDLMGTFNRACAEIAVLGDATLES